MEVVGEAADGQEVVRQCLLSKPDVVTMDVRMPGADGVQAAGQISRLLPRVAILAVSDEATLWGVDEMFAAGASGYILEGVSGRRSETALRTVACGGAFIGRLVIDKVLAHRTRIETLVAARDGGSWRPGRKAEPEQIALHLHLTPGILRQILRCLGQNASTSAISRLVSPRETE
jgi:DNA-binding NarL/FixJ family response regulator